jgi:O-antigen/teichoic acid export membrane protein
MKIKAISPKMMVLADQAVVSGTSFATNIMVARSLGVTNYGKFSVIILVQLFLLSLQQAVSSGVYQVSFGGLEKKHRESYTSGIFYGQSMIYAALILICLLAVYLFPALLSGYEHILLPAMLGTLLFLMQDFLRKILLTKQMEGKAFLIDAITNITQVILLAIYAYLNLLTLALACWIIALTFIPSVVAGVIWVRPKKYHSAHVRFTLGIHRNQSHWMFMSSLLQWFTGNFFVVAAGFWLGVAALGALRLAQYIFGLLNVVIQAIENYVLPKAATLKNSGPEFTRFLQKVFKKTMVLFLPVLLLFLIFARQILQFSGGASYNGYSYVIYGLVLVYILILTSMPIRIALRVKQLNRNYFLGYVLSSIFSMLTARWLIKDWQLTGVLAGLFFTQLIVIIYWSITLSRKKILTWKLFTSY